MWPTPELAILVSSYQRPWHLERVLASIVNQRGVVGRFEVVVTDDGSTDETLDVVERYSQFCGFPLTFTTHPHRDFQLARCRNEGVRVSTAPYLLFLDGDCLIPPDHVRVHLRRRREGVVQAGFCYRLDRESSEGITIEDVFRGDFMRRVSWTQIRKLATLAHKSQFYNLIGHRTKPKLFGGNIGIARCDYELVNGYDESFVGWGGEDDDLRLRLRAAGIRIESILPWTRTYHLWHPPVESAPARCSLGRNIDYLLRADRETKCRNGLNQPAPAELQLVCEEVA